MRREWLFLFVVQSCSDDRGSSFGPIRSRYPRTEGALECIVASMDLATYFEQHKVPEENQKCVARIQHVAYCLILSQENSGTRSAAYIPECRGSTCSESGSPSAGAGHGEVRGRPSRKIYLLQRRKPRSQ